MDDWTRLAEALNARMRERNISQKELAERSGISVATLRQIQNGKPARRSPATLGSISRALDWPADYLRQVLQPDQAAADDPPGSDLGRRVDTIETQMADLNARVRRLEEDERGTRSR